MITHMYPLRGETCTVNVLEDRDDVDEFRAWFRGTGSEWIGVDSETTGLDTYAAGNRLRTVQFGDSRAGWVVPVERHAGMEMLARETLERVERCVLHNAAFDLQVFEQHLGVDPARLWAWSGNESRLLDTRILAHLVDPRGQDEGGIGQSLEALVAAHIDPAAAEQVKALMATVAKRLGTVKTKVWKHPDLLDDPDFQLYAGMDPVFAARLARILFRQAKAKYRLYEGVPLLNDTGILRFEHELARVCAELERTGFLLDTAYAEKLSDKLAADEREASDQALAYFGVESVNSTADVAQAFEDLGVRIKGRTPSGKPKVDAAFIEPLIEDAPEIGSVGHLAAAVHEAKRARKWRTTWVDGFLAGADPDGRVHPSINPLRARTARMSISGIPAQTLPSSDWLIRRCFIADPGQTIVSVDYKAQELRVLAALSRDETMVGAFADGLDLHQMTADAAGVPRSVGKMGNFLQVYGGGARNLADKAGITLPRAKAVIDGFNRQYPGVARLKTTIAKEAASGRVITPTGRVLPVDEDRAYTGLNYLIQSTSRDITAAALLRLDAAGITPYLRLPVHDEVVASVPTGRAEVAGERIAAIMRTELGGVLIDTEPEVYGPDWGAGYITTNDDRRAYDRTWTRRIAA